MIKPANYLLAEDRPYVKEKTSNIDKCVPDQALSIPELLARCVAQGKAAPVAVDYDIESIEREYDDLVIPEQISRADALMLLERTKAHASKLEFAMRESKKREESKETPVPPADAPTE